MTRVLITGSAGHVGRALVGAYRAQGDEVIGLDLPGTGAEIECDLDRDSPLVVLNYLIAVGEPNIVVCNAKTRTWEAHHGLAKCATRAIVNVSSIYGVLGNDPSLYEGTEVEPTPAWYCAAKAALVGLTRWQATNLAPVRSNCVILGGIERGHSALFKERYISKVPLRRMATETDAVEAIMWLASEKASYVNGVCLPVCGGLLAQA